jgi:YVTN family beta-propeller protein
MTQRSRFYDSVGGDRIYTSDAWAQVLSHMMSDGVVSGFANELAVSPSSPAAMSVRVNTGAAFVQGYMLEVYTGQETLALAAADASLARIDRIVVRRDLANRTSLLAVLPGVASVSPAVPALTQVAAGVWEISLATVAVAALASTITAGNITDDRGVRASAPSAQPLDADLTAIAALSTTAYGRAFLALAGQAELAALVRTPFWFGVGCATVTVGTSPIGVAVTPSGAYAYVANSGSTNVSVIRTSDNTVVATVTVGTSPYGVAVTPSGAYAYVANTGSANVSVIRTSHE